MAAKLPTVVFQATFRARGYSEEDIQSLREEVEPFAAVRLRGQYPPEAGGVEDISILLQFIGENLAKGGVAWIGGQILAKVTKAVHTWWKRKARTPDTGPELHYFTVSFDDADVEFCSSQAYEDGDAGTLHVEALRRIPEALDIVRQHFTPERIKELTVQHIAVPLICPPYGEMVSKDGEIGTPGRYWRVGIRAPFATDLYDRVTRDFLKLPDEGLDPFQPAQTKKALRKAPD